MKIIYLLLVVLLLSATAAADTWCYQEFANASTCGDQGEGYYFNVSNNETIDGDNSTYALFTSLGATYFIPNQSTGAKVQVRSWSGAESIFYSGNVTVNASVFSYNSSLNLYLVPAEIDITPLSYADTINVTGYNSSGYVSLGYPKQGSLYVSQYLAAVGVWWNMTPHIDSCVIVPSPANSSQNLSVNATGSWGNFTYKWFNSTGEVYSTANNISAQPSNENITVECTLNNSYDTYTLNSSTLVIDDDVAPTLFGFSVSDSTPSRDDVVYLYFNCTDAGSVYSGKTEIADPAGNKANYTATLYSGDIWRGAVTVNSAGTWNYTSAYCTDGSNNTASNTSVNISLVVTVPPTVTGASGGGNMIIQYNTNFTSSPARVYEIFVYPIAGKTWVYELDYNKEIAACSISAPFTCEAKGSTIIIEYPFNDSIGAYGDIKAELQATSKDLSIARTSIQVTYLNLATYYPVDTDLKIDVEPLFTNDSEGNIIGLKLWWIILIIVYASTKYN